MQNSESVGDLFIHVTRHSDYICTEPRHTPSVNHIRCDNISIDCTNIIWLEGDWNYTRIYLIGQPMRLSAYTLGRYEQLLGDFVRISKKAIVNPAHVHLLYTIPGRPSRLWLQLTDGKQIEVARRRRGLIKKRFGNSILVNLVKS